MPKKSKTEATDIAKRLSSAQSDSQVSQFLQDALAEFGGPKGLAHELKDCYDTNDDSGQLRFRILDSLVKLMLAKSNIEDDEDDLSLEEMEAELRASIGTK